MISVHYINFRDWKLSVADAIQKQIMKKGSLVCADACVEIIHHFCRNTIEDLNSILSYLEKFRTYVHPADQTKRKNSIEMCLLCA